MFIDDMNLKRFSGWWYNAQERFDFIQLKDGPRLAQMEGVPLADFFSVSGERIPAAINFDGISCSSFEFRVTNREPGLFLLHQMYDARWGVRVDGESEKISPADDFFMGVNLQPGSHTLQFFFQDRIFFWSLIISGISLFGVIGCVVFRRQRLPVA